MDTSYLILSCMDSGAKICYYDDEKIEVIKDSIFRVAKRKGAKVLSSSEIQFTTYSEMQSFASEWISTLTNF